MAQYEIKRTPEQGHTKLCLATAMMMCLQGWINADDVTDHEFRTYAQENGAMHEADDLLQDGNTPCLCPRIS